mgnify:CR=1 FL=1|tara:strand:+ start:103 stop:477 length:375 start_codon:yes stop_codon:yes gene_type:complete
MRKLLVLFVFLILSACNSKEETKLSVIDYETVQTDVIGKDVQLVDVRTSQEFNAGHIDDAINIDISDPETFTEKVENLDKEKPIYIYCQMGGRSKKASQKLKELGFKNIFDYSGGYGEWSAQAK